MPSEIAIVQFIVLAFSVVLHEVAHGYMALSLGDPTARLAGRLTLNPIKHIDILGSIVVPLIAVLTKSPILIGWAKPVPYNPYNLRNQRWGEALVAAAGPGINLLVAIAFALITRLLGTSIPMATAEIFVTIIIINVSLAVFNLSPFPPLDGFKILKSILPHKWNAYVIAFERNALFVMLFFILFLWQFFAPLINIIIGILL
jgi:Zn-dependent protease